MKKNSLPGFLLVVLLLIVGRTNAQSNNVRGFYVRDCTSWLGNTTTENQILSYAQSNGFNYITLYGLGSLSWSSSTAKNQLASFISRAHLQYGINEIGAAGEIYSFFSNYVIPYNNSRSYNSEKIDVCNFEFEFWNQSNINALYSSKYLVPNGYTSDTAGAFKYAFRQFQQIKTLAASKGMVTEIYLGWPNKGQVLQIAGVADRILLHAYRQDDSDVYQYSRNRLMDIASGSSTVKIIPIFSSEPAFMQAWLANNPVTKAYDTYSAKYTAETGTWKSKINLQGYQWFNYTYLPHNTSIVAVAAITASGSTNLTSGQSVTLTANSGSAYLWSPGGQTTRSITVTTAGSYTVRVTNSTGQQATSTPVTVNVTAAITATIPTITASGSLSICDGSYVTLTSSQASSYLWSSGETTRSIVVRNAGTYSVRAYAADGSYLTSATKTVTVLAAPSRPSVSLSGSTTLTSINPSVTLTSSSATAYRWSSGSGNRSITITNGGIYKVTVTNSNGCTAVSNPVTVTSTQCTPPPVPTITASASLTINIGDSITLTSTAGDGYLWSTGEHSRSITVSTSGSYWVRVYNKGGCFSASLPVQVIAVAARMAETAISSENTSTAFSVTAYPNPAYEQLNLNFTAMQNAPVSIDLIDLTGRQVYTVNNQSAIGENKFQLDIANYPRGIYFARLSTVGYEKTIKVVLE